jgi:UDPglucose--hexose-1-phosphate uridylyltransferase
MPELRKDPVLGRWVIISTERGKRPSDFNIEPEVTDKKGCPFCEGCEDKTPPEIFAFRDPNSKPNTPNWEVRVVANKFPVLRIEGDLEKHGVGMYDQMNGIGAHEVIIETPDHFKRMEALPVDSLVKVLETCKIRMLDLMNDHRFRYILFFKNEGLAAGASLSHSHSQLIATPVTPKRVKEELDGAKEYFQYKDRCVFCDMIREEMIHKTRVVYENKDFVAYCPFASRFPFELSILPKRHNPDYHNIQPNEMVSLADMLKVVLTKLSKALNRPQYNFILHTAPVRRPRSGYWTTIDYDFHWHIEVMPRLTKVAGFEWGTGFYINPTVPEEAAKFLQETKV